MNCIIHIGTEKTGTTLLQQWLYENTENLSAQGIGITSTPLKRNNSRLANRVSKHGFQRFFGHAAKAKLADKRTVFDQFDKRLADEINGLKKNHNTVIFTSEFFHSHLKTVEEISALKELLSPHFEHFKIVCYFREQSEVRKSLYSTALKVGESVSLEDFRNDVKVGNHYYNYNLMLSKWQKVFGKEALDPVLYDRKKFLEGDIRKDFISRALADVRLDGFDYDTTSANEKFNVLQAEIARAVNKAQPQVSGGQYNVLRRTFIEKIVACKNDDISSLHDSRQMAFFKKFSNSNTKFAQNFLGEEKSPFKKPKQKNASLDDNNALTPEIAQALHTILVSMLETKGLVLLEAQEVKTLQGLSASLKAVPSSASEAELLTSIVKRANRLQKPAQKEKS